MLKSKLSELERYTIDGITTVIYYDEYRRVHKYEYSQDYSYIAHYDEIDQPYLTDYITFMDCASNQREDL